MDISQSAAIVLDVLEDVKTNHSVHLATIRLPACPIGSVQFRSFKTGPVRKPSPEAFKVLAIYVCGDVPLPAG